MKKWAAYLLIVYFAAKIPSELFIFHPTQQLATFATTLVGAGLWPYIASGSCSINYESTYKECKNFRWHGTQNASGFTKGPRL